MVIHNINNDNDLTIQRLSLFIVKYEISLYNENWIHFYTSSKKSRSKITPLQSIGNIGNQLLGANDEVQM